MQQGMRGDDRLGPGCHCFPAGARHVEVDPATARKNSGGCTCHLRPSSLPHHLWCSWRPSAAPLLACASDSGPSETSMARCRTGEGAQRRGVMGRAGLGAEVQPAKRMCSTENDAAGGASAGALPCRERCSTPAGIPQREAAAAAAPGLAQQRGPHCRQVDQAHCRGRYLVGASQHDHIGCRGQREGRAREGQSEGRAPAGGRVAAGRGGVRIRAACCSVPRGYTAPALLRSPRSQKAARFRRLSAGSRPGAAIGAASTSSIK